jgi:hypothetical protein
MTNNPDRVALLYMMVRKAVARLSGSLTVSLTEARPNNRFERSRGSRLRWAKEGVDDLDKSVSFIANATPRRSTSSLGPVLEHRSSSRRLRLPNYRSGATYRSYRGLS